MAHEEADGLVAELRGWLEKATAETSDTVDLAEALSKHLGAHIKGIMMDARRTQEQADARAGELQEALQEMIAADRKRIASIDAQRETLAARENDLRTVEDTLATSEAQASQYKAQLEVAQSRLQQLLEMQEAEAAKAAMRVSEKDPALERLEERLQDEQLNNDELQLKLANTELKASDLEQELTALRQTHNVTLTHLEAATERMEAMEAEMGRAIATTQEASAAREAELGTQIAKLQARVNNDGKQRHRDTAAQLRTELNSRNQQFDAERASWKRSAAGFREQLATQQNELQRILQKLSEKTLQHDTQMRSQAARVQQLQAAASAAEAEVERVTEQRDADVLRAQEAMQSALKAHEQRTKEEMKRVLDTYRERAREEIQAERNAHAQQLQQQRRQLEEQRRVVEANCTKLDMDLKAAMHQLQLCPTREALEGAREEASAVKRKLLVLEEESRSSSSIREQASKQLAEAQSELTRQTRATVEKCEELAALRKELAATEAAHHTEMQHAQKEAMQLQYVEQQLHALVAWKAQVEPTLADLRAQLKEALSLNKETEQYANALRQQLSAQQSYAAVEPAPPVVAAHPMAAPPSAHLHTEFHALQRKHEALKRTVQQHAMQERLDAASQLSAEAPQPLPPFFAPRPPAAASMYPSAPLGSVDAIRAAAIAAGIPLADAHHHAVSLPSSPAKRGAAKPVGQRPASGRPKTVPHTPAFAKAKGPCCNHRHGCAAAGVAGAAKGKVGAVGKKVTGNVGAASRVFR